MPLPGSLTPSIVLPVTQPTSSRVATKPGSSSSTFMVWGLGSSMGFFQNGTTYTTASSSSPSELCINAKFPINNSNWLTSFSSNGSSNLNASTTSRRSNDFTSYTNASTHSFTSALKPRVWDRLHFRLNGPWNASLASLVHFSGSLQNSSPTSGNKPDGSRRSTRWSPCGRKLRLKEANSRDPSIWVKAIFYWDLKTPNPMSSPLPNKLRSLTSTPASQIPKISGEDLLTGGGDWRSP